MQTVFLCHAKEDSQFSRDLTEFLERGAGFQVFLQDGEIGDDETIVSKAVDGLQALGKVRSTRPHLIVLDLMMPVMDGWEFIDQLWKQCQEKGREFGIPVIVLSGSSGQKGVLFGKSVHGDKCKYSPIVTIAKEECIKPAKYNMQGEKGLVAWLQYFLRSAADKGMQS
jgi:CheY-like chemotaxis protein